MTYPFVPKSNRTLRVGQFWAFPLTTGRYAAGRIMVARSIPAEHRILTVIGLEDWSGDRPPTGDDLAGRAVVHQAISGWQTITHNDGVILGERPLELDRLVPMPMTGQIGETTHVKGWMAFKWRAEELFGSREPWIEAARRQRGSVETLPGRAIT